MKNVLELLRITCSVYTVITQFPELGSEYLPLKLQHFSAETLLSPVFGFQNGMYYGNFA